MKGKAAKFACPTKLKYYEGNNCCLFDYSFQIKEVHLRKNLTASVLREAMLRMTVPELQNLLGRHR
jgi:hypothetical protein